MKNKRNVYILFGPPGSGKTNVANLLSEQLKLNHVSWGHLSRSKNVREVYKNEFVVINDKKSRDTERSHAITRIIAEEISRILASNNRDIVLEGFPRRHEETVGLINILKKFNLKIEAMININPSLRTVQNRLEKRHYCIKCKHYYEDVENEKVCSIDGGTLKQKKYSNIAVKKDFESYVSDIREVIHDLSKLTNLCFDVSGDTSSVQIFSNIVHKLMRKEKDNVVLFKKQNETILETKHGVFRLMAYQSRIDYTCHLVIAKGHVEGSHNLLVRVHSSCITGDILGSDRCDCGEQLAYALDTIEKLGRGMVIYLFQEGRGINIINKIDTYRLQRNGVDTVDANELLGFPAEMRDYTAVKDILRDLDIKGVRLLTNNPDKISKLTDLGITIEGVEPVEIRSNKINKKYLKTKKEKMGHELKLY